VTTAILVGAGGLGGPIAAALGAAGWDLAIYDHDVVDRSNLHRQIQFGEADVGRPKAALLAARTPASIAHARRWTPAAELAPADIFVDASDDPATKFAVCDAASARALPCVIASALRHGGNVFAGAPGGACYRCLFEDAPTDAPTCADAGVLGPVVGAIGGVAAALALALIAEPARASQLLVFDDVRTAAAPRAIAFAIRAGCPNHPRRESHDADRSHSHRPA
jgi:adenylyltransferase/sulfurtransferase